ncbi:hypothetical protein QVD17_17025 [Tagetes erecta]|uniref:Uncharacterized protein n=1 Tax=Tagetes erecta TaxID=13708 RepID=A0AAD8KW19_TARER|nr:hypothetical protein QVD17_17025 [Tagetes erecta]
MLCEQIDSDGESCESTLTTNKMEAVENSKNKTGRENNARNDLVEAAHEWYREDQVQLDEASDVESSTTMP